MKSTFFALLIALLLPAMADVSAQQSTSRSSKSSSFKGGFSSQKSSSTSSNRGAPSFGSFGGGRAAAQQKSDSVLSQRLNKSASEANALRTLDARRAADQAAFDARNARPLPADTQYGSRNDGHGQANLPAPAPIVVQQGSNGIGEAVTGFLLGRATSGSHARRHDYPASRGGDAVAPAKPGAASSFLGAMLRIFAWLVIASIIAWTAYFIWKFLRRGQAPSTANYSFER